MPTPYAEQIYQPIQNAAHDSEYCNSTARLVPSMLQSIKIAIHDEIEPIIFPQLVHHFSQLNLDIQFLSSKLDRKNMLADLSAQNKFLIDLVQPYQANLQFENLIDDHFVVCTQQMQMDLSHYSPHHISVYHQGAQAYCLKIFISIVSNCHGKFSCVVSIIPLRYKCLLNIPMQF